MRPFSHALPPKGTDVPASERSRKRLFLLDFSGQQTWYWSARKRKCEQITRLLTLSFSLLLGFPELTGCHPEDGLGGRGGLWFWFPVFFREHLMGSKQKLSQGMIHKYAKSRMGFSTGHEVSPYQVACKALEADGRPQESGVTWKRWVLRNADFILGEVAKLKQPTTKESNAVKHAKNFLNAARKRSGLSVDKSPDQMQRSAESRVKTFQKMSTIDPASDGFLQSFEWRSVRMMALKKYSPVCMCCGASPQTGAVLHVDHVKPRKIFPQLALDVSNLQILCGDCNHGKGNWDMTDWRVSNKALAPTKMTG